MKKKSRTTVLTFRVSEDEEREFRLAARAEQVSVSCLIRLAVRERAAQLAGAPNHCRARLKPGAGMEIHE